MPAAAAVRIQRLAADELTRPDYRWLAQRLFGAQTWATHVRYCHWLLAENPASHPQAPLPLYVHFEDERPAGQLAIIPADLVIAGQQLRAGWCVDFHVLPEHQRKGIGRQLLEAAGEDFPVLLSLGQTNASGTLFRRCCWFDAGQQMIVTRPVSLFRMALQHFGRRAEPDPQDCGAPAVITSSAELRLLGLDYWFDRVETAGIRRTTDFVAWRYLRCPRLTYVIWALTCLGQTACLVWRRLPTRAGWKARIVDFIHPDADGGQIRRWIATGIRALRRAGCAACEWRTTDPETLAVLQKRLLVHTTPGARLLYGRMDGAPLPQVPITGWSLSAGDCDVDAMAAREGSP